MCVLTSPLARPPYHHAVSIKHCIEGIGTVRQLNGITTPAILDLEVHKRMVIERRYVRMWCHDGTK